MIQVKGQKVTVGRNVERAKTHFTWDNENGQLEMNVKEFRASKFLVSNGEYLEFVKSQAYNERKYWDEEGWAWKQRENVIHPLFWIPCKSSKHGF